jgi:hypothetical protein
LLGFQVVDEGLKFGQSHLMHPSSLDQHIGQPWRRWGVQGRRMFEVGLGACLPVHVSMMPRPLSPHSQRCPTL